MHLDELEWKDEYGIGVEKIDNAHREFFRIVRRIQLGSDSRELNSWAAREGIKFLKAYVLRHFEEEEEFMRSINYKDYELHKAQHEHLKSRVVPKMESYLHKHSESKEAIGKFLQILTLWIKRHILAHDKAIGWEVPETAQK